MEAASAIDELLDRSQDTTAIDNDNKDSPSEGFVKRDRGGEGDAGGATNAKNSARRMRKGGWIGSSRWSKTKR